MSGELPLVCVIWDDTSTVDDGTWVDRAGAPKPKPCIFHSVGFLLEQLPDALVLSQCVGETSMSPRERIPLGCVLLVLRFDPEKGEVLPISQRRKS